MAPKISVCIPAYNRRAMFRTTLWSVLNQSFQDMEIIISDNVSQEDLKAEVDAANDARVHYIRREKNFGGAENFAFLQAFPKGEYVLFLCSDDLLLPDCVERAVAALDANPERGGLVYMAAHYGDDGFHYLSTMPDHNYGTSREYVTDREVRDFRYTSPSLCIFRRATFEQLGGWNRALKAVIDWELYSRMVRHGQGVMFLHDALAIMRLHGDRDSNTTALNWGFYHDIMLLSAQPEYSHGNAHRASVFFEQLLRDMRQKRSPWRTLAHAYDTGAFPIALLYFPWEVLRRAGTKFRALVGASRGPAALPSPTDLPAHFDRSKFDSFWRASEIVRLKI